MINIGILGSGEVGKSLANGFLKHGYQVAIGSDHLEKLEKFKSENPTVDTASFEQVSLGADIIILCVKGTIAEKIVEKLKEKLAGKVVIDTTNPIADLPPENGVLKYFTSFDESLMERLQKIAPNTSFVKSFNSIGSPFMVNPDLGDDIRPTMFICGNNENAKKKVTEIVEKFGFEAEDMGNAESARAIEPLCMLWCIPGLLRNEWAHAFKLLKK